MRTFSTCQRQKKWYFSPGLYPASEKDRALFGPNAFLNCKTLPQYQLCYSNWLVEETNTREEISEELDLVKNFRIIYSREAQDPQTLILIEKNFRKGVIENALSRTSLKKKRMIINLATEKEII